MRVVVAVVVSTMNLGELPRTLRSPSRSLQTYLCRFPGSAQIHIRYSDSNPFRSYESLFFIEVNPCAF